MTPERIFEIAHRYSDKAYPHPDDPASLKMSYWEFREKDLIAFAQAIIEADRESSDEPDGYITYIPDAGLLFTLSEPEDKTYRYDPVYRHPPPAQKLTDEAMKLFRDIECRINGEEE